MTTSAEFVKSGIKGHTFREIAEKYGKPFNALAEADPVMANFALGFAWFREREHLEVQAAYEKADNLTVGEIEALFEDSKDPAVKAAVDFVSPPPRMTP